METTPAPGLRIPLDAWLRVGEVCRLINRSPDVVRSLVDRGLLIGRITEGGQREVLAASVDAYLKDLGEKAS